MLRVDYSILTKRIITIEESCGGENKTLLDVLPHLLICIKNKIWKDFVSSIDHPDQYCAWTKDSLQGHSLYQIMLNKLRVTVAYIIHKTKPLM